MVETDAAGPDRFALQDSEYHFPYHYLPHLDSATGAGVAGRRLGWGLEYLTYVLHCLDIVSQLRPASVLDVGCGDGRFLGMLPASIERRVGVDLSERAIGFARAFNPDLEFHVSSTTDGTFDVVTAIEVLEHVPPDQADEFIRSCVKALRPGGYLVVSVPTVNARLQSKHYRHFTLDLLRETVELPGLELKLATATFLVPETSDRITHLTDRMTANRYWTLDVFGLRRFIWNRHWTRRVTSPSLGRHLVAVWGIRTSSEPSSVGRA